VAPTAHKFSDGDNQSASNTFTGTIGVTVVEVLANGNLIVAGEKQVAMNKGTEFIRFSGMVNPDNIGTGNTVSSTQVADARVEYRTNSQIDRAEMTAMASRFFQSCCHSDRIENHAPRFLCSLIALCLALLLLPAGPGRAPEGPGQHRRRAPEPAVRLRPGGRPGRHRRPDHPDPVHRAVASSSMLQQKGVNLPAGTSCN
jgi:hypothetical protein